MGEQKICEHCGEPIPQNSRRWKYCSVTCYNRRKQLINKPYYLKYHRKNMRLRAEWKDKRKYKHCINCGNELGKYKKKFCSYKCRIEYNTRDIQRYEQPPLELPHNDVCEECGGKVIHIEHDWFCEECGLIQ